MTDLVTLADCPPGLFMFGDTLGFKSEYKSRAGDREGVEGAGWKCDAYCVESGEFFWGGKVNWRHREQLMVQPLDPDAMNLKVHRASSGWLPAETMTRLKTFDQWTEEDGSVLWFRLPTSEPPYVGSPLDLGFTVETHGARGMIARGNLGGWPFDEADEPFLRWTAIPVPELYLKDVAHDA